MKSRAQRVIAIRLVDLLAFQIQPAQILEEVKAQLTDRAIVWTPSLDQTIMSMLKTFYDPLRAISSISVWITQWHCSEKKPVCLLDGCFGFLCTQRFCLIHDQPARFASTGAVSNFRCHGCATIRMEYDSYSHRMIERAQPQESIDLVRSIFSLEQRRFAQCCKLL